MIYLIKRSWDNGRFNNLGFMNDRDRAIAYAKDQNARRDPGDPFNAVEVEGLGEIDTGDDDVMVIRPILDKCVEAAMKRRDELFSEGIYFVATKSVEKIQRELIIAALECYETLSKEHS